MTSLLKALGLRIEGRLQPTDLHVDAGEFVGLIGPNGGGKTSLLRCIADIEGDADRLELSGEAVKEALPARRPHLLTFLPASREIVWPISARDSIALGLPALDEQRIVELIALLELAELEDRPVNSLSTGERSRVLLARALAPSPGLLLLDEPLSNLDPYWVLRTIQILRDVVDRGDCSALVALHDLHQAEAFDRILLIDQGRILLDGTPADVLGSSTLQDRFGVERRGGRWSISRKEDPRSLP